MSEHDDYMDVIAMKKVYAFMLLSLLLVVLAACNRSSETIRVLVPEGTPAMAQTLIEHNKPDIAGIDYTVERVSGPQLLVSAFTAGSHDIIIAPLNIGANLASKNAPYQLAAVVTWGNLQLISDQPIDDIASLEGRTIHAFGMNAVPGIVLETVLDHYRDTHDFTVNYDATNAQQTLTKLTQNPGDIALVAQPVTTLAAGMLDEVYTMDLAELWVDALDLPLFPQAGVFVHERVSVDAVNAYLDAVEDSVAYALDNPASVGEMAAALDYPFSADLIEASLPYSRIAFKRIADAHAAVIAFFEVLMSADPELIGGALPDETFYWSFEP